MELVIINKIEDAIEQLNNKDYNNAHELEAVEGISYLKDYDLEDILNIFNLYFKNFDRDINISIPSQDGEKRIKIERVAWFNSEEADYCTFAYNITVIPEEYEIRIMEEV